MSVLFLEYPACSTCKKARKWLDEHGVRYTSRNIVEDRPDACELAAWKQKGNLAIRRMFNTSGMRYRELGVKAMLDGGMDDEQALELLASDGMLVRRPWLVGDDFALAGFKEAEWERAVL